MQLRFEITNGPSREELFDGLRLFSEKRPVQFVTENNGRQMTSAVIMQAIEIEDGSGNNWNIKFQIGGDFLSTKNIKVRKSFEAKGFYSTKKRTGYFTIEV